MHQPYYKDLKTGEYLMPWVRLHGSKDYLDMLLLLDEFPGVKQTFNLVPSLLDQLKDYSENGAQDRHLLLSRRPAQSLTDEENLEVCHTFFSAHYPTMIQPYLRYRELHNKCRERESRKLLLGMTPQDILDLQVWSNAVWIDPMFRDEEPVAAVFSKRRNFTEEMKNKLLDFQVDLLRRTVPAYRERQDAGQIEVSFSPYYHPILPLLVDTHAAREALPKISLPEHHFQHPEDARTQVARSAQLYRELFGRDLRGMWPSEGSVSQAILPILAEQGVRWIASDEEVYFASRKLSSASAAPVVNGNSFHRPFTVGGSEQPIGILFRDHRLSDKIGFVYSNWDAAKAADDFIMSLHDLSKVLKNDPEAVVSIILDGENAWEYYKNDGEDFLRALYSRLEEDDDLETVLPSELFAEAKNAEHLPKLFAGSWINHNFRVWIGHEEDNAAWDLLSRTRDALVAAEQSETRPDDAALKLAWEDIYIAEGSDWCWWYGDEHHTEHFSTFDYLFRKHLQNVWELIGQPIPQELHEPLRKKQLLAGIQEPTDFVKPIIDGRRSSYFEWFGAGKVDCRMLGGSMHRVDTHIEEIFFGYNHESIYFRVDFDGGRGISDRDVKLVLSISAEIDFEIAVTKSGCSMKSISKPEKTEQGSEAETTSAPTCSAAWGEIVEIAFPRALLKDSDNMALEFAVSLFEKEKLVERWPEAHYITLELPKVGETLFWEV
jgi:alpha-amylase/alpha-mannosidase (GH57 family)